MQLIKNIKNTPIFYVQPGLEGVKNAEKFRKSKNAKGFLALFFYTLFYTLFTHFLHTFYTPFVRRSEGKTQKKCKKKCKKSVKKNAPFCKKETYFSVNCDFRIPPLNTVHYIADPFFHHKSKKHSSFSLFFGDPSLRRTKSSKIHFLGVQKCVFYTFKKLKV